MKKKLSVSLMCCDLMNVAHDIKILEEGGVDWFHLDVMDAHFVPNLTFGPDFINSLRKISQTPFDIHLMMTTHSPFILSDIPNELISYMEKGHQLTKGELEERKIRQPMAGNISELLHQSFFLHKGFIGEYARKKILSLVEYLKTGTADNDRWDDEQAKLFIDGISEPYISKQLRMLYDSRL